MELLDQLAEFKKIIKDRSLAGSVSATTFGYVYNQPFFTENIGKEFEEAKENLKTLVIE